MLTHPRAAEDATTDLTAWLATRGIATCHWPVPEPGHPDAPHDLPAPGQPLLYLVAADALPPPRWGEGEDWIRLPATADEVHRRAADLLARTRTAPDQPRVDGEGLLHVDGRTLILTPMEGRLLGCLLAQLGRVVSRDHVSAALWPDGPPSDARALDNRLKAVRNRIAGLPLQIHTVRGRGLMVEHAW